MLALHLLNQMACAGTHNDHLLGLQRLFSLDWTLQLEPANNQMLDRVLKNICVQIMCQPGQQFEAEEKIFYRDVIQFNSRKSMQNLHVPSFFRTKTMVLDQGELLGLITFFSSISFTCSSTISRSAFGKRRALLVLLLLF